VVNDERKGTVTSEPVSLATNDISYSVVICVRRLRICAVPSSVIDIISL
jgi:hypothetical protein